MSDLLADFTEVRQLAKDLKRTERTILNWCNEPGGLPFLKLGAKRYIHLPTARQWLMSRVRVPNPDRRRRGRKR